MSQYLDLIEPPTSCKGFMIARQGVPPGGLGSSPEASGGALAMTVASIASAFFQSGCEAVRPNPFYPKQPPDKPYFPEPKDPRIPRPPSPGITPLPMPIGAVLKHCVLL